MIIPSYSAYRFENDSVIRIKDNKPVTLQKRDLLKLKDDSGKWKTVTLTHVKNLCGITLKLPDTVKPISSFPGYYIDIDGSVYSFSSANPNGKKLTTTITSKGYPSVSLCKDHKNYKKEVHILMARAFLMEDYIEKGLCCMHLDDDKLNCNLSNLAIGTYSQNNKDAYTRGLNPGNGLSKRI